MNSKILLVDDEVDITNLIEEALTNEGSYQIKTAHTGNEAIEICREFNPDIVLLDIKMPDLDGLEVCKRIREFSFCPILFLSSKNDEIYKLLGLSIGGDDYITKPFSPREVVYRIKSHLRRQGYEREVNTQYEKTLTLGEITVKLDYGTVYKNGKELILTGREYLLLTYMMKNKNKIISKEKLYEDIWGECSAICDNTIMVHIHNIREKIEENPSIPKYLVTVKGLGYKMVESR